jgi:hypothetical protein
MGFFTGMLSSVVKVALTPVAIVKDVVNIATGEEADTTASLLEDAAEDAKEAIDDLYGG